MAMAQAFEPQHALGDEHVHRVWDNALPHALEAEPGDVVVFDCPSTGLPSGANVDDVAKLDSSYPHRIVGPVFVAGAEPGDALVIDVLDVELANDYGHTFILPGLGLLPDEFPEPYVHNFDLGDGRFTELRPGVRIPIQPFCGIMGVAPAEPGEHATLPPRTTGGNLDVRHLTAGSTLVLPVEVEGAMFSCGDGHAAQGDGEVCVTGLETAVRPTLRLSLRKRSPIAEPIAVFRGSLERPYGTSEHLVAIAAGPDLYECSRRAVRYLLGYLVAERDLTRQEAYVLTSLIVDLKISEIVDRPNFVVSAFLPLGAFAESSTASEEQV